MRTAYVICSCFPLCRKCRWPFRAQWLLYVPPGLRSEILHSSNTVHVYVLCGSQTEVISL